jgi:hypothetical protein
MFGCRVGSSEPKVERRMRQRRHRLAIPAAAAVRNPQLGVSVVGVDRLSALHVASVPTADELTTPDIWSVRLVMLCESPVTAGNRIS